MQTLAMSHTASVIRGFHSFLSVSQGVESEIPVTMTFLTCKIVWWYLIIIWKYGIGIWPHFTRPAFQVIPLSVVSVMVSLWIFLSLHHWLPLVGGKNKNKKRGKKKSYIAVIGFLQLILKNWFSVSQQATDGAYMSSCPLQWAVLVGLCAL